MSSQSSSGRKTLVKKVELLLEECGFDVIQNPFGIEGPDIRARAFGKSLYVWCRQATRAGAARGRLPADIKQSAVVVKKRPEAVSVLVYSGYHVPKSYLMYESTALMLAADRVIIWDDGRFDYYNRMSKAIGPWSVYQILTDLKLDARLGKSLELPAVRLKQGRSGYIFKVRPVDLLRMAYVFRRTYGKMAYQRVLNPTRLRKEIAPYIEETNAVIPTSIVCVFTSKVVFSKARSVVKVPFKTGSVWIIDGQHRLYAFCHVADDKRSNFELSCVGYSAEDIPKDEQARMFIDINQTARKVPSMLLYDLYELINRTDARVEIVKKLAKTPIFKGKVSFSDEKGYISLVTFATNQSMSRLMSGGVLHEWYTKSGSKAPFDAFAFNAFKVFFGVVSRKFRNEWNRPERHILASNRGIRALLRLMIESMRYGEGVKASVIGEVVKAMKGVETRLSQMSGKYAGEAGATKLYQVWEDQIRERIPAFGRSKGQIIAEIKILDGEITKAKNAVKLWLGQLKGEVVGELSYVDKSTIAYLKGLRKPAHVRLKVGQVWGLDDLRTEATGLVSSGVRLEVCLVKFETVQGSTPAIHERWLADEKHEIDFGVDLMDQSLGKKEHTIQVFDRSAASERWSSFDATWMRPESAQGGKRKVVESLFP